MSRVIVALGASASAYKAPEYYDTGAKWTDFRDSDKITVHIVPHTHDDTGWNKNIDEYFSGTKNDAQEANVQIILDTVSRALIENRNRTFTYVEQDARILTPPKISITNRTAPKLTTKINTRIAPTSSGAAPTRINKQM